MVIALLNFAIIVMISVAETRSAIATLLTTSAVLAGLLLLWVAFWDWFFRDGLGPGMQSSQGLLAWISTDSNLPNN
jgi:hypothetical protein